APSLGDRLAITGEGFELPSVSPVHSDVTQKINRRAAHGIIAVLRERPVAIGDRGDLRQVRCYRDVAPEERPKRRKYDVWVVGVEERCRVAFRYLERGAGLTSVEESHGPAPDDGGSQPRLVTQALDRLFAEPNAVGIWLSGAPDGRLRER